jgi:4-hydroxy-3-polyprenylbenzoate decarboxylase
MVDTQVRNQAPSSLIDLRSWLASVEAIGELQTIDAEVDPIQEMSALAYLSGRRENPPTLLFTNVRGAAPGFRQLFSMIGPSRKRLAIALGLTENRDLLGMVQELRTKLSRRIEPITVDAATAPVNEVILRGDEVDLFAFAPPQQWPLDGGRFIGTGDVVITRDPELGILNVGTYRMMVHDRTHTGMCILAGRDARLHVDRAWRRGQALPVAAVVGIHPMWVAMGSQKFPPTVSEYDAIGGLMGQPMELIKAEESDLLIPAHAEIVLEGTIEPEAIKPDGPFGEFTGYYGADPEARLLTVTSIHHRRNPILTNSMEAEYPSNETSLLGAVARSARLWDDLDRLGIPGIRGVWCVPAAVNGRGMVVISVEQRYPGHVAQVLAIAAQAPTTAYYTKWIIAVDDDVDPTNMNDVLATISTRFSPADDVDILRQTMGSAVDPSQNPPETRLYGSKLLINACKEHRYMATFPKRMAMDRDIWQQVASRWSTDFNMPGEVPRPWRFEDPRKDGA